MDFEAARTRSFTLGLTGAVLFNTRETVAEETPAWRATSSRLGRGLRALMGDSFRKERKGYEILQCQHTTVWRKRT